MLLSAHRQLAKLPALDRTLHEWNAYRLCGLLLLLLTLLLQGVVVMIVRKGDGFTDMGQLIFMMAIYDFYCLISSACYIMKEPLIKFRTRERMNVQRLLHAIILIYRQ